MFLVIKFIALTIKRVKNNQFDYFVAPVKTSVQSR